MEKDYSLLRPFDLEAAKRGENICNSIGQNRDFTAERDGNLVVYDTQYGDFQTSRISENVYRMAPLAWVEGKPVYRGDVLYKKAQNWQEYVTVTGIKTSEGIDYLIIECENPQYSGTEYADNRRSWLTWQKPKTKREGWMNCYPNIIGNCIHETKESADNDADCRRIACVKITWEE